MIHMPTRNSHSAEVNPGQAHGRLNYAVCICIVFLTVNYLSACHYYYYRTDTSERPTEFGTVHFELGPVYSESSDDDVQHLMRRDTTLTYLGISVLVYDTSSTTIVDRISVDSLMIKLKPPFGSYRLERYVGRNYKHSGYLGHALSPIGIPSNYKQDFRMLIKVKVFSDSDVLIYNEVLEIEVEYHKEGYFLFDSPYG